MILAQAHPLRTRLVALGAAMAVFATTTIAATPMLQGDTLSQSTKEAAANSSIWPDPDNVSKSLDVDSEAPALAVAGSGIAHIVWEEGDGLHHSHGAPGHWSEPSAIPGAGTSEQPALAAGPNNRMHLVYVNDLDLFYAAWDGSAWSVPKPVSKTPEQVSDSPDIAVAWNGSIHVVAVEQTTSGKRLYYATSVDGSAWPVYLPVPSAYGEGPSIAVGDDGEIHISYRGDGDDDIYIIENADSEWSLPRNVSESPGQFSTGPDLSLAAGGVAELVWQEMIGTADQVRYGRIEDSISPLTLSDSGTGAYQPSLTVDPFRHRHVGWVDGTFPFSIRHTWTANAEHWPTATALYGSTLPLQDVALGIGRDGVAHAAWTEIHGGKGEIYYASKTFHEISQVFLPLAVRK